MNHHEETTRTPFAEVAASLARWAGRAIDLWVAHEDSGDGLVAEFTGLKVERVEGLDEFDHGLDGDAVRVTLSAGGEVVGELVVEDQLLVSAGLDPRQVELRLGGVMVGIAEARMTSETP